MTLSMFPSLEEFSGYLKYGSYQTMSRIRIGYAFKPKDRSRPPSPATTSGGNYRRRRYKNYLGGGADGDAVSISENVLPNLTQEDEDKFIEDYENGLKMMYGGRGKRKHTTRKNRFRKRKITKRRKKKRSLKKKRKRVTKRGV